MLSLPEHMVKTLIAPLIPYITVGAGLLIFHSAWTAILSYHIGMAIILLLFGAEIPLKRLLQSNSYKIPIFTSVIGASGGILLYALWPLLSVPENVNSYIQNIGLTEKTWTLFLAYYILVNPLLEEYYWRGYLGSNSKRIEVNDFLFSAYHVIVLAGKMSLMWLVAVFLILSVAAWFWRQIDGRSEGLLASMMSHIAADITIIFTIYRMTAK